jgi:hypothetical protein
MVRVYGPGRLHFKPIELLNVVFNADPDPTFHSNADPDPANADPDPANADPDPQPCLVTLISQG